MRPGMRLGRRSRLPAARARRAGSRDGRAVVGGGAAPARGRGFSVEPVEPGTVYFETRGVERLYGGLEPALKRALSAVGPSGTRARGGRAAVRRARRGDVRAAGAGADRLRRPHAALPRAAAADAAPARAEPRPGAGGARDTNDRTACRLPGGAVAERLGPDGRRAWSLARGEQDGRVAPRRPARASGRDAGVPGSSRPDADAPARASVLVDRCSPDRNARVPAAEARPLGAARRRRLVAPHGDAPRADSGPGASASAPWARSSTSCQRRR